MPKFKIEKNVPLIRRYGRPRVYPFKDMKVGDSFLINGSNHISAGAAARRHGLEQSPPWIFTVRKTPKGYRIWRMK